MKERDGFMDKDEFIELYEFMGEQIDTGICAIDKSGQILFYNKKMREMTGLTEQEEQQRLVSELLDVDLEQDLLHQVIATREPVLRVKHTFWNHNGEEISMISDYRPFITKSGKCIAVQFARDVTQQEFLMDRPLSRYGAPLTFDIITAVSKSMKQVIQQAKIAAMGRIPVMLIGESGTGKDMIAEGIHHELKEPNERFITLICRRNEEPLIRQIEKYIAGSHNYTFFAERIEYLSMDAQERITELLAAHAERNHVFIASIGTDPIDLIQKGRLSKNLYYLFSNLTIQVPALRERREDIMPFIEDYFTRRRINFGVRIKGLAPKVQELFLSYDWPGNLKELEVLLDDISSLLTTEEYVEMHMLPAYFKWKTKQQTLTAEGGTSMFAFQEKQDLRPLDEYMREVEDYYITRALELHDGNISQTARTLGLHRQSLQYRLRKK